MASAIQEERDRFVHKMSVSSFSSSIHHSSLHLRLRLPSFSLSLFLLLVEWWRAWKTRKLEEKERDGRSKGTFVRLWSLTEEKSLDILSVTNCFGFFMHGSESLSEWVVEWVSECWLKSKRTEDEKRCSSSVKRCSCECVIQSVSESVMLLLPHTPAPPLTCPLLN